MFTRLPTERSLDQDIEERRQRYTQQLAEMTRLAIQEQPKEITMNFLAALKHAIIGYGIRRKSWPNKDAILHFTNLNDLEWLNRVSEHTGPCVLLGRRASDLHSDDLTAIDWETI